jgi:translation initiation factor IF-2
MRRMLGIARVAAVVAIATTLGTVSVAQPPDRPEGPPDREGRAEGREAREDRRPGGAREGRAGPGGVREGRGGPGGPREGRGGPGGPPSPERFVEHAMKFDADGDGKLDRGELTKFAEEIQRMRGGAGGRGGPGGRGPGGPGGFGGPDGPSGGGGARPPVPE